MDTGRADIGNQQGNRQGDIGGLAKWRGRRQGDMGGGRATGVAWGAVRGGLGRSGKVGQNEQKFSTNVVSNECRLMWMWSRMNTSEKNVVSNEWSQMNGLKSIGLNSHGTHQLLVYEFGTLSETTGQQQTDFCSAHRNVSTCSTHVYQCTNKTFQRCSWYGCRVLWRDRKLATSTTGSMTFTKTKPSLDVHGTYFIVEHH